MIEIDVDLLEENCLWQRKTSILIEIVVDLLEETTFGREIIYIN